MRTAAEGIACEPMVVIAVPAAGWNQRARNRLSVLYENVFRLREVAVLLDKLAKF
jgi:hypothetical protein